MNPADPDTSLLPLVALAYSVGGVSLDGAWSLVRQYVADHPDQGAEVASVDVLRLATESAFPIPATAR